MEEENQVILGEAYIKYEGKLVENGFLDARKSGEVLIGIDEIVRYFIFQEEPRFQELEFEIPVRVRKGSWETIFLEHFNILLLKTALASAITWGAGKYIGTALEELAKNDFKDVGFKDIFRSAVKGIIWVVKIAKHLGSLSKRDIEIKEFSNNNKDVSIQNSNGEILIVPVNYLQLYINCPENLFAKLARVIEEERELVIGLTGELDSEVVKIEYVRKQIFLPHEDELEVLFPELKHGDYVELVGHVTRGNENANNIGFQYNGHILTCFPNDGNINNYKMALFTNCILKGFVDRVNKKTGETNEKRPKIKFIEIHTIDPTDNQLKLF